MLKTKIAKATPFEGAPKINMPSILGASRGKPIMIRVAVTGKRPMELYAELPDGLTLNGNVISGKIHKDGDYSLTVLAKNDLGEFCKKITLEIKEHNVLVTPLLGYTTWNAFADAVTQADVEGIADKMVELGIAEYGYGYVNTDSGWQKEYGGEFDAVMPNEKFPDMKKMTDKIHALGLKCGIYSTPMLTAWGCPKEFTSIPGCTRGEADYRFSLLNGGIGVERCERNNALQWNAWGFDYLKYDWAPTDSVNADLMRRELVKLDRDFGFCVTVCAIKEYSNYWSKYCNSYRSNPDTYGHFANLAEIYETYFKFAEHVCKGHYFDLDMMDIGTCRLETLANTLTEDEQIMEYSMRAFLSSPIQISSTLESPTDTELNIYCNEEIIAINQDCAFNTPTILSRVKDGARYFDTFEKALEDGTYAYAFFNLGEVDERVELAPSEVLVRDLWAKEDLFTKSISVMPHTARIIKSNGKLSLAE